MAKKMHYMENIIFKHLNVHWKWKEQSAPLNVQWKF